MNPFPVGTKVLIPATVTQSDAHVGSAAPALTVRLDARDHVGRETSLLLTGAQVTTARDAAPVDALVHNPVLGPLVHLYNSNQDFELQQILALGTLEDAHEALLDLRDEHNTLATKIAAESALGPL